jgi:hypothetical protein
MSAVASATPLANSPASATSTGRCTACSSARAAARSDGGRLSARSVERSAATASPPPKSSPTRWTPVTPDATAFESEYSEFQGASACASAGMIGIINP